MHEDAFVSVVADNRAREEILEQGFTRRPLCIDVDVARRTGHVGSCSLVPAQGISTMSAAIGIGH